MKKEYNYDEATEKIISLFQIYNKLIDFLLHIDIHERFFSFRKSKSVNCEQCISSGGISKKSERLFTIIEKKQWFRFSHP